MMNVRLATASFIILISSASSALGISVQTNSFLIPIGVDVGFWEGQHLVIVGSVAPSDVGRVWLLIGHHTRCGIGFADIQTKEGVLHDTHVVVDAVYTYDAGACGQGSNRASTGATVLSGPEHNSMTSCQAFPCSPPPAPPSPSPRECGLAIEETKTWLLGANGVLEPAPNQLAFGLERYEGRPESSVYLEEWAVVSATVDQIRVRWTSTKEFGERVEASSAASIPGQLRGDTFLIIEIAADAGDMDHSSLPTMTPLDADVGRGMVAGPQGFWFRAEVNTAGRVDRVALIQTLPRPLLETVEMAIRERLRLQYDDERRHRTVVFAHGTVSVDGGLSVENGMTIVPACCCSACCYDPEFGWLCPCGGPCIP